MDLTEREHRGDTEVCTLPCLGSCSLTEASTGHCMFWPLLSVFGILA